MIEGADGQPQLVWPRIVDMTSGGCGPYAAQFLCDFGAEVIKVEAPGGDFYRHLAKPAKTAGLAPGVHSINRVK